MNGTQAMDAKIAEQFTILVYPFRHALRGRRRSKQLKRLRHRWRPWFSRMDHNGLERTLDDTYFFLPYVRKLLFPETALLAEGDAPRQVTQALQLANRTTDDLAADLDAVAGLSDGVLRLTYNPEHLNALHPLHLEFVRHHVTGGSVAAFSAPIRLWWVDVVLFPQNVGFLALKVQLGGEQVSVNRLNDFLYYLRLVHPPTLDWQLATWQRTTAEAPLTFESRDLVDFLLQGLTEGPEQCDATFDAFISRLYQNRSIWRYSATGQGQVYGQAFRQYTYA
jgi:hypothetical protein